jgi:glycerol-3-phosphate dehydrogenase (NAD(P)+)
MKTIGIIGAGAWGTALAQAQATAGRNVLLWAREEELVDAINNQRENAAFLPNVKLDKKIKATGSLTEAAACDIILVVTPAQHVRTTLQSLKGDVTEGKTFVICAKGVEIETGHLMSQVAKDILPTASMAVMSGPTFAAEIARGLPGGLTIACDNKDVGAALVENLSSRTFRTYLTDDVLGAQIGGAVKNVIAIAAGVVYGRGMGDSARAALVTRGMAEMGRLASAMGAKRETLMGMCGMGDLILTCSSMQSRNFSLGVAMGQGKSVDSILGERKSVTEGVSTAKALMVMARNHAVDMPISAAVNACLSEGASIEETIERVLDRPLKMEAA